MKDLIRSLLLIFGGTAFFLAAASLGPLGLFFAFLMAARVKDRYPRCS